MRWTGKSWKTVANPEDDTFGAMAGVYAVSASDAWAVGWVSPGATEKTRIEHWNGKTWS